MFRLNRLTDYAIVVLGRMSQDVGRVQTAASLSDYTGIPAPTVSKLLKTMGTASLISSHRGASGGYSLDRPANAVTVADIVQALEGPIAVTACVDESTDCCDAESFCPMNGNWNRVNQAIRAALECVTLADMTNPEDLFPLAEKSDRQDADARPEI